MKKLKPQESVHRRTMIIKSNHLLIVVLTCFFFSLLYFPGTLESANPQTAIIAVQDISAVVNENNIDELIITTPYKKPTFFSFSCSVEVHVRKNEQEQPRVLKKEYFLWSMSGTLEISLPLSSLGEKWEQTDVLIVQQYSKQRSFNTGWFPLAAIIQHVHCKVLMASEWYIGYQQSVRVISLDNRTGLPQKGTVYGFIEQKSSKTRHLIFEEELSLNGTCSPVFSLDSYEPGEYQVTVRVTSAQRFTQISKTISLKKGFYFDLDSPADTVEQGENLPVRAYLSRKPDGLPEAGAAIRFTLLTPSKRVIDDKSILTNEDGEAIYNVYIPPETETGHYSIVAEYAHERKRNSILVYQIHSNSTCLYLDVPQTKYCVHDTLTFTCYALNRNNRKPIASVPLKIYLTTPHRLAKVYYTLWGTTDQNGVFQGTIKLNNPFKNHVFESTPEHIQLVAAVQDKNEKEDISAREYLNLYATPNHVTLQPIAPVLVPKMNQEFLLSIKKLSGEPVSTAVTLDGNFRNAPLLVSVPDEGETIIQLDVDSMPLRINVRCDSPFDLKQSFVLDEYNSRIGDLLIRMNDAQLKDDGFFEVLSPEKEGTLYTDIIQDGQLVATASYQIKNGSARIPVSILSSQATILSLYSFSRSLTARKSLLSSWVPLPLSNLNSDVCWDFQPKNLVKNSGEKTNVTISGTCLDGKDIQKLWIDYYALSVPLNKSSSDAGSMNVFRGDPNDPVPAQSLPSELNPSAGFISSNLEPALIWKRIHQGQIEKQAEYIWKKLPLHTDNNFHLTTDSIIKQKLLTPNELRDPWGHPFVIDIPGRQIYSLGQDGKDRTGDELFARGGWFLIRSVQSEEKTAPNKAGIAVVVYESNSMPARTISVTVDNQNGQSIDLEPRKSSARFFNDNFEPGLYRVTISGPLYETFIIPDVTLIKNNIIYVRVSLKYYEPESSITEFEVGTSHYHDSNRHMASTTGAENLKPSAVYLLSESKEYPSIHEDRLDLTVPSNGDVIAVRITPRGQKGVLNSKWGIMQILRECDITLPKSLTLDINKSFSVPIQLLNKTENSEDVSIAIAEKDWFRIEDNIIKKTRLQPGVVQSFEFDMTPELSGQHSLDFSITFGQKQIIRNVPLTVRGAVPRSSTCHWRLLSSSADSKIPYKPEPFDHKTNLSMHLYNSSGLFLRELAIWLSLRGEAVSERVSILRSIIHLKAHLAFLNTLKESSYSENRRGEIVSSLREWYQRLLLYQTSRGAFSIKQRGEPDLVLTATVLKLIDQLSKVIPIDQNSFRYARYWLLIHQDNNGKWTDSKRDDAMIAWSLASANTGLENIKRTISYYRKEIIKKEVSVESILLSKAAKLVGIEGLNKTSEPYEILTHDNLNKLPLEDRLIVTAVSAQPIKSEDISRLLDFFDQPLTSKNYLTYFAALDMLTNYTIHHSTINTSGLLSVTQKELAIDKTTNIKNTNRERTDVFLPFLVEEQFQSEDKLSFDLQYQGRGTLLGCFCFNKEE